MSAKQIKSRKKSSSLKLLGRKAHSSLGKRTRPISTAINKQTAIKYQMDEDVEMEGYEDDFINWEDIDESGHHQFQKDLNDFGEEVEDEIAAEDASSDSEDGDYADAEDEDSQYFYDEAGRAALAAREEALVKALAMEYSLPTEYEGFNLMELIGIEFDKIGNFECPDDYDQPIYPNDPSPDPVTKGEFASDLNEAFASMKETDKSDMIKMLARNLSANCSLPVHYNKKNEAMSRIHKYVPRNDQTVFIDICKNGCMVYVGKNKEKTVCDECGSSRFYSSKLKTPEKVIQYRPIVCTIAKLLHEPRFIDALNYEYLKPSNINDETRYMDIRDGSEYKKHMSEMQQNITNLVIQMFILCHCYYLRFTMVGNFTRRSVFTFG